MVRIILQRIFQQNDCRPVILLTEPLNSRFVKISRGFATIKAKREK